MSSASPALAPGKPASPPHAPWTGAALGFVLLLGCALAAPFVIRNLDLDWINAVPAAASLYFCYLAVRRPYPAWFRQVLFLAALALAVEAALRIPGYHRTLYYERAGDLPFTPVPNQKYVEKLSLTRSASDANGLRIQPPLPASPGRRKILCLGDSITYGIGLPDGETYPARLQAELERRYPGRFEVLNAGVNAYPVSFEHQRFLYLWNRGVRPDVVVVGFSMNEGWLGHIVTSDAATKDSFETRVKLKNAMRSLATYNYLMEKAAKLLYDRLRLKLVPGTHNMKMTANELDDRYEEALQRFVSDLRQRNLAIAFVDFCSLNYDTKNFDTLGNLQQRFAGFASANGIPCLRTDHALARGLAPGTRIDGFFFDPGHMNVAGTKQLAPPLADFLEPVLSRFTQ
jgi:lysophospholipase L1-like esterase